MIPLHKGIPYSIQFHWYGWDHAVVMMYVYYSSAFLDTPLCNAQYIKSDPCPKELKIGIGNTHKEKTGIKV